MLKLDGIQELVEELKGSKSNKENKDMLVELYKRMKLENISEEIENNNNAKENAIYGLKLFLQSNKAIKRDRKTREVIYTPSSDTLEYLDTFEKSMINIINNTL